MECPYTTCPESETCSMALSGLEQPTSRIPSPPIRCCRLGLRLTLSSRGKKLRNSGFEAVIVVKQEIGNRDIQPGLLSLAYVPIVVYPSTKSAYRDSREACLPGSKGFWATFSRLPLLYAQLSGLSSSPGIRGMV